MKKHSTELLVSTNVVGILIYLFLASRGWRISEENGGIPIAGEPFVWVISLPVLLIVIAVDVVWGAMLVRGRARRQLFPYLLSIIMLFVAIAIDFSHH